MSESIKQMYQSLFELPVDLPDFVVNKEIEKRAIHAGDYKPTINNEWGDVYWKFNFKNRDWDINTSDNLQSLVNKYKRFDLVLPKTNDYFTKLMIKERSVTSATLDNHFLIFDNKHYEKIGFNGVIEKFVKNTDYEPHSYVDHISNETSESREEALQRIADRTSAIIGSNYIIANNNFLVNASKLFEEIGSNFFGAKIQ